MQQAKFAIGQIVQHRLFDYIGVICDVDYMFLGSDEWYEQVARTRPPKDQPWYHVLVDNARHQTYVAERNLEASDSVAPIQHPLLGHYFSEFKQGRYLSRNTQN